MMKGPRLWIFCLPALIVLAILPQVIGIVKTNIIVSFAIDATFAISLNLLLGYTGLLSFGHAMFFGAGAYATALSLTHIPGLPLLPAIFFGALAACVLAVIVSPLLARVTGTAFAMLTLAFGQLLYVICLKFREVTGGEDGIAGFPIPRFVIPGIASFDMKNPLNFYYFAMIVLGICIGLMWFITKTPFGNMIVAIRDNPRRVSYLGCKVQHSKALILILSGTFAGVAGSIFALFQNVVSTDGVLNAFISFAPLMMAYVGGIGSFFGPIFGSGILHLLDELTSRYTQRVDLVNGVVFILVVIFAPYGFVGVWRRFREWWKKSKTVQAAQGEPG
jgi:branched-chain amino acid transport system permease protein